MPSQKEAIITTGSATVEVDGILQAYRPNTEFVRKLLLHISPSQETGSRSIGIGPLRLESVRRKRPEMTTPDLTLVASRPDIPDWPDGSLSLLLVPSGTGDEAIQAGPQISFLPTVDGLGLAYIIGKQERKGNIPDLSYQEWLAVLAITDQIISERLHQEDVE